jgi:phage baseplate assembly protein W
VASDYGVDVGILFEGPAGVDIDATGALVSGVLAVAQAVARRLLTPRGSLLGDPNYGLDIRYFLGEGLGQAEVYALERAVAAEAEKDERVLSARATASLDAEGTLTIEVDIESDEGPFGLVLNVGSVTTVKLKEA